MSAKAVDSTPTVLLAGSDLLSLDGPDAVAFAHAQFMSDVAALADGGWQWSGLLSPKGRVLACFALVRISAARLLLWLPAGGGQALADHLQRFVFRSKLRLAPLPEAVALGRWGRGPAAGEGKIARLDLDQEPELRGIDLIERPAARAAATSPDPVALSRWRRADLRLGLPYIAMGSVASGKFVPQWLSLERLQAFSVRKGCYPGQEIVARMHFLGQGKRSAWRLAGVGASPPPLARVLDAEANALGEVVWADGNGDDWLALTVLSSDRAGAAARVEGHGPAALAH